MKIECVCPINPAALIVLKPMFSSLPNKGLSPHVEATFLCLLELLRCLSEPAPSLGPEAIAVTAT